MKKGNLKKATYILHASKYMTFWKRHTMETVKRAGSGCQWVGRGRGLGNLGWREGKRETGESFCHWPTQPPKSRVGEA